MIIYKVKEVLREEGVTTYRLVTDKVLSKKTWENFTKGSDLSLKVLGRLCTYLNCDLDDLVEYVQDNSFEAKSYLVKKAIKERKFDDDFNKLCEETFKRADYDLCRLAELYNDSIDSRREEEIVDWMYDVIEVERITRDFEKAVSNAKKNPGLWSRFQNLEEISSLLEDLVLNQLCGIQADGSLSRLCNLRDEYNFYEILDTYLDVWREENTGYDEETGDVIGTDYTSKCDVANDEIIPQLSDNDFINLVDSIDYVFGYNEDKFYEYVSSFIESGEEE